ncbi:MAG: DUF4384 domain-containing protein [Deltaproteobacteria bacterium]|nr:DUF4384 domain-containing protein [Deltaproteobacteria bacterium]
MAAVFLIGVCLLPLTAVVSPALAAEAVWAEAEGTAYQGETETLKEVKDRALRDGQNKAIEGALGVFIKSHTLVSNYQIAEDLTYASVRGRISKTEVVREGWDPSDRLLYRVALRALVEPVLPETANGLSIKLSLSKTDMKEGDEVRIFYQASADCYVYIFSVAADGSVTLIFPDSLHPGNSVKAKTAYQFPPNGSAIRLKAEFLPGYAKPEAEERIKVIATRSKEELLPLGFREGLFKVYDARSTGMINDLVKRLNQLEPAEWAEATAAYTLKR